MPHHILWFPSSTVSPRLVFAPRRTVGSQVSPIAQTYPLFCDPTVPPTGDGATKWPHDAPLRSAPVPPTGAGGQTGAITLKPHPAPSLPPAPQWFLFNEDQLLPEYILTVKAFLKADSTPPAAFFQPAAFSSREVGPPPQGR